MLKTARKQARDPEGRMPLAEHLRELITRDETREIEHTNTLERRGRGGIVISLGEGHVFGVHAATGCPERRFVLRQAQHERTIANDDNASPVRPELVEG